MEGVERDGTAARKTETLSDLRQLEEVLVCRHAGRILPKNDTQQALGLRTTKGVEIAWWKEIQSRVDLGELARQVLQQRPELQPFIALDAAHLRLTSEGLRVLDAIVPSMCMGLENLWTGTA